MIASRCYNSLKFLRKSNALAQYNISNVVSRSAHRFSYRSLVTPTPQQVARAEMLGGIIWGWIIYHFINNYGEIFGEYEIPDPSKWTDEELGIPPMQ